MPDHGGKIDIILSRLGASASWVYGFAKNQRADTDDDEEEQFKEAAKDVLALTEKQLAELLMRELAEKRPFARASFKLLSLVEKNGLATVA